MQLQSSSPFQPITTNTLVELRTIYFHLCEDNRLLVRREASRQFIDCYTAFGVSHFSKFLALLKTFLNDDVGIDRANYNRIQFELSFFLVFRSSFLSVLIGLI